MTDPQPPVPPVPPADGATPPPPAASVPPAAPAAPAQPAYPAYGQPTAGYSAPPTNTLAIIALVLGFVLPLGGIIAGHIALGQIKRTGEGGRGLALAGLILGYAFTAITIIIVIAYVAFFAWLASTGAYYSTF